jgi:hypothetical protein
LIIKVLDNPLLLLPLYDFSKMNKPVKNRRWENIFPERLIRIVHHGSSRNQRVEI